MGDEADKVICRRSRARRSISSSSNSASRAWTRMAIDMEVLSINPFWYGKDRDTRGQDRQDAEREARGALRRTTGPLCRLCLANAAISRSRRAAARDRGQEAGPERRRDRRQRAGRGFLRSQIPSGLGQGGGTRRGAVHSSAEHAGARPARFKGNGWLSNTIGNPLDTTIALQHLIFEGTLDKFPGSRSSPRTAAAICRSYAPRSDHACFVSPQNCNPDIKLKKKPTEYLNQLYFDALVFTPEALRHLVAQVGASQVMLGTDHPIPWEEHPVDHVFATTTLSDKEKAAILGGNAARLFGITGSA